MRTQKSKPTRAIRNVQKMMPDFAYLPFDGFQRLRSTFTKSLNTTKQWTLARDYQMNVDEALEREKTT